MLEYKRPPDESFFFTLAGGKRGILQTVFLMRQIVDRFKTDSEIRNLALSLVSFLPPKDETGEITAGYHGSEFEHVYVFAKGEDVALHLDATEPEPAGWEAPGATAWAYCE